MIEEIITLEEQFQPYLQTGDYTFIGPADEQLFEEFIKTVTLIAPVITTSGSVHDALSNKMAVKHIITRLPKIKETRVYIMAGKGPEVLQHTTIEEYCLANDIRFPG